MGQKKSEFDKVFSAWDILVIAFGAMIGWGWVVSSGTWIDAGGVVGAALAFAIGGVMIFFVGLTYAELTAAMPQCGGEHVFSYKACGDSGGTTKERYLEILEFTHFVEFFSFNKIGENHKEKILVQRVTVIVALDLGTGNTKNPEYENE